MRRLCAFALLIMLASVTCGQRSPVGITPRTMLLATNEVKKEIKLTKDQDKQILEAMKAWASDMRSGSAPIDFANPLAGFDEKLGSYLTEAQTQRLNELYIQANGGFSLLDAKVADKLELTDDQKAKAKEIDADAESATRERAQKLRSPGDIKNLKKMRDGYEDKIKALQTPEQAAKFAEMQGKPFKFRS